MEKFSVLASVAAILACAAPAAAGGSNVKMNNIDVFLNQAHPFDNRAAGEEAARAVPGAPVVDPAAGQSFTHYPLGPLLAQPHPFDSPAARAEAVRAIPGAPRIDPRAAVDLTRPDVTPLLNQPFPFEMWAPPHGGAPPLPGEPGYTKGSPRR